MLLIFCAGLFVGCAKREQAAITIDSITISANEFEEAYQSGHTVTGRDLSRKEFLDWLISRKLMLKEAETLGLDKEPKFLQGLQLFWEQSLLKFIVARKMNELAIICQVSEKEIIDYYERHKDKDYAGKEIPEVHDQVKLLLFRIKERLELQRWSAFLKRKAKININYNLLNIPK
jgi:hypothetical protein